MHELEEVKVTLGTYVLAGTVLIIGMALFGTDYAARKLARGLRSLGKRRHSSWLAHQAEGLEYAITDLIGGH